MRAVVRRSGIWILVLLMLVTLIQLSLGDNSAVLNNQLESIAAIATGGNMTLARNQLRELIADNPDNIDVLQLQGKYSSLLFVSFLLRRLLCINNSLYFVSFSHDGRCRPNPASN